MEPLQGFNKDAGYQTAANNRLSLSCGLSVLSLIKDTALLPVSQWKKEMLCSVMISNTKCANSYPRLLFYFSYHLTIYQHQHNYTLVIITVLGNSFFDQVDCFGGMQLKHIHRNKFNTYVLICIKFLIR